MTDNAANKDWALFKVTGRDAAKGYLYTIDIETGKKITLAKRAGGQADWAKNLCDEATVYFAPDGAVIAAFGVRYINDGFATADYANSVAKIEEKQEVIVAPMKISRNPKKLRNPTPTKESFVDVVIQDKAPLLVPRLDDLKDLAIKAIEGGGAQSYGLEGMRGFMLRTVDADGTVNSWEFLGMQNSSPRKTWDYHFGLTPAQGRNRNLLESAIGIAKNKFSTPGAIVEVVGLTRMPINDFNSQKTVNKLASSINYCTTLQDGRVVGAYSIAAIVFEKGRKNIVFSQTPLPRHAAGSTTHGRFVIPYAVVNDKLSSFSQAAQAQNSADAKKTELNRATKVATDFPLRVEDHVNGMGQVSAFNIIANDGDIGPWAERVVNSIDDITPIKIATRAAYSYPIRFRAAVLASLSDLMGTPPLYLENISGDRLVIKGRVGDPSFRDQIDQVFGASGVWDAYHDGFVMPNTEHAKAAAWLHKIGPSQDPYLGNKRAQEALEAKNAAQAVTTADPAPVAAGPSAGASRQTTNVAPAPAGKPPRRQRKLSFGEWQERQFRKDPYMMMNALSEEISRVAEEAGIDWNESQQEIAFSSPGVQGALIKSNRIRVLKPDYKGSVGISAHLYEKHGSILQGKNGESKADSYITFKINFFNPKVTGDKSKVITYASYADLHRMYERDMAFGQNMPAPPEIDTSKLDAERAARAELARSKAEAEARAMKNSLDAWNRETFLLPKEAGTHDYIVSKKMAGGLDGIDIRTGVDKDGSKFIIKRLHDINDNFMGAQQIFDRYSVEKGVPVQVDALTGADGGPLGGEYSLGKDFSLLNGGKPVFYAATPKNPRSPVRQIASGILQAADGNEVMHNGKPVYFNNLRQFVTEGFSKKNKKFVYGTRFTDSESGVSLGTHCKYGEPTASSRIYFAEGLATGDALYQAVKAEYGAEAACVVVCLDSGNLPAVVSHYRQKYPTHQFVIGADNDIYKPRTGNAGMRAAMNAAINSKCLIARPDFSAMDQSGNPTDWKDLQLMAGLPAVTHQLKNARPAPSNPVEFYRELLAYSGTENLAKDMQQAVSDIALDGSAGADRSVIASRLEQGLTGIYDAETLRAAARLALEPGHAYAGGKQPAPVFPVSKTQGDDAAKAEESVAAAASDAGVVRIVDFPVTIERRISSKEGKPYLLIKDASGLHADKIEAALKRDGSTTLFNTALNGWIARAHRQRILGAELYELTGDAQLYLSSGMRDKSKTVVRGDFSDPTLVESTLDLLKGFNCRYVPTEYGIIFEEKVNAAVLENRLGALLQPQEKRLVFVEPDADKAAMDRVKAIRAPAVTLAEIIGAEYGSSHVRSIIFDLNTEGGIFTEEEKAVIGVIDAKIFARAHSDGEGMLSAGQRATILAEQISMVLGSPDLRGRLADSEAVLLQTAAEKLKVIGSAETARPFIDPQTLDEEAVKATAQWFDLPEPVVVAALTTSRSDMMMGEKSAQMFDEQFPVATLPLKEHQVGFTATTYTKDALQYAATFNPADISAQNQFQMDKLDFDPVAAKFLEWSLAGFRAPPMRVWKNAEGKLVTSSIRRLWAAQKAGAPITAMFVADNKHTGRKLSLDALVGHYAQQVAGAISQLDVVAEHRLTNPEPAPVVAAEVAASAPVADPEIPAPVAASDALVTAAIVEGVEAGIAAEAAASADAPMSAEDIIDADIQSLYSISSEVDRLTGVISDINLMVENFYTFQEIKSSYLDTPACPYFSQETGEFNDMRFASDCKNILKSAPDAINGISQIASPEDIYDIAYGGLAAERLRELDAFMCAFFAEKGPMTLRSFYNYVNGTRELKCGMQSPYFIDGEFMNEQMTNDIKTLTEHPTIISMYDAVMESLVAGNGTQILEQVEDTMDADANQDHDIDISMVDFDSEIIASNVSHHGAKSVMVAVYRMNANFGDIFRIDAISFSKHEPLYVRSAYYSDQDEALRIMKSAAKSAAASGSVLMSDIETDTRCKIVEMRSEVSMNRLLRNESFQIGDMVVGRVTEYRKTSGDPIISDKGLWQNPRAALIAFNILYDMDAAEYEKSRVMRDAIERSQQKRTQSIGEFLKESAAKNVSTQELFRSLTNDFGVKLDDSQQLMLKTQYMKLCAQIRDNKPAVTESMVSCADECRFDVLIEETRKFIAQRLSYDVYVNDMFRADGLKIEYNPYFNHEKNALDGDALRADLKKMKAHSLARLYETEFLAVHGVNSFDVKIDSPYQSIPNNTDSNMPLRVRFSDIENLLSSAPDFFTAKETLPSFEEWLRYPVSVSPIHPVLAEDVAMAKPEELFEKYGVEPLLLLASVSCIDASSAEEDGVALARMIIESTKAMEMISSYSDDELKYVEPEILSDFARIFQIPELNDPSEQTDVLIDYLNQRREISRLRVSEYSYLATAISMEKAGMDIPAVVSDSVNKIVNGSKEFMADVADVVFRSSTNLIRKDINFVESVMFSSDSKDVIGDLVVLDYLINKVVAYGGKQDQGLDMVKYDYKYMFRGNHGNVSDLPMPAGISSFAIFEDNAAIATATPLPNSYLVKFGMKPISKPAIEKALAPYAEWIAAHGELTMVNAETEVVTSVTMTDKGIYRMNIVHEDGRLEPAGAGKSLPRLLMESSHYGIFADIDGGICLGTALDRDVDQHQDSIIDFDAMPENPSYIAPADAAMMAVHDAIWHVPGVSMVKMEPSIDPIEVTAPREIDHFGERMTLVVHHDGMIEFGSASDMAAGKRGVVCSPDHVKASLYQAMNLDEQGRLPELKLMTPGQAAYAWMNQSEDSEIHVEAAKITQSFEAMGIVNGMISGGMIRNIGEYAYFSHLRDAAVPGADPRVLENLDRMLEIIEEREQIAEINSPSDDMDADTEAMTADQSYDREIHAALSELYSIKYWAACCANEDNEAIQETVKLALAHYPGVDEGQIRELAARMPDGVDVVFDAMSPTMEWAFTDNRKEFPLSVRDVNPVDCSIMLLEAMQKQALERPRALPETANNAAEAAVTAHDVPAPADEEERLRRQLEFGTGIVWWVDDQGDMHNGVVNGQCFEGDTKMPVVDVNRRVALEVDVLRIRDAEGVRDAYKAKAAEFKGHVDDLIEMLSTFREASIEILADQSAAVSENAPESVRQALEKERAGIVTELVDTTCALNEAMGVRKNIQDFSLRTGIDSVELVGLQYRVERDDGIDVTAESLDEIEKMMRLEQRQAGINKTVVSVAAVSAAAVLEDVQRKPATKAPAPEAAQEQGGQMGLGF